MFPPWGTTGSFHQGSEDDIQGGKVSLHQTSLREDAIAQRPGTVLSLFFYFSIFICYNYGLKLF
jgi:hypothetical protein